MKKINIILIVLSILTIALFPVSVYGTVVVGMLLLGFTFLKIEDEKVKNRVLQNITLAGVLVGVKSLISLFTYMFKNFFYIDKNCYNNGFYQFLNNFEYFMNGFLGVVCIAFVVVAILSLVLNFSLPFFETRKTKVEKVEKTKEIIVDEDEEI